jgi:hypothetical protein
MKSMADVKRTGFAGVRRSLDYGNP